MSLSNNMEEYYQKVIHLQEKLRQSEEQRLQLEMKFNEMLQVMKEEEEAHFKKLRSKYKQFLEEDRRRQHRNDKILEALDRIENRTAVWEAKTQKFKTFRKHYHDYLKHAVNPNPFEDDKIPDSTKQDIHPPVRYDSQETKTESDRNKHILEKYLETVSSQKCKDNILQGSISSASKYSNLGNVNSVYWKNPTNSEKASGEKFQEKTSKNFQNSLKQNISTPVSKSHDYSTLTTKRFFDDEYDDYDYFPENYDNKPDYSLVLDKDQILKTPKQLMEERPEETPLLKDADQSHREVHNDLEKLIKQHKDETQGRKDLLGSTPHKTANLENLSQPKSNAKPTDNYFSDSQSPTTSQPVPHVPLQSNIPMQPQNIPSSQTVPQAETRNSNEFSSTPQPLQRRPSIVMKTLPENASSQPISTSSIVQPQPLQRRSSVVMVTTPTSQRRPSVIDALKVNDNPSYLPNAQEENKEAKFEQVKEESKTVLPSESFVVQNDRRQSVQSHSAIEKSQERQEDELQMVEAVAKQENTAVSEHIESSSAVILHNDDNSEQQNCDMDGQPQFEQNETEQLQQYQHQNQYLQQYYDENGQPLHQYDEQGHPLIQYDENGQPIQQYYDENGQPLQGYAEVEQSESHYYDQTGQQYDENGQPLQQYDENGQPILQYDQQPQYDQNVQYDEHGQVIQQFDANGQPIMQQISQFDEHGQHIPQYNENEQYFDGNGQPIQYYGQEQYDENGQPITEQQQYQPYEEQQQHFEQPSQEQAATKLNIMEILDTDTESVKQESKISNDSDFDFTNN